MDKNIDNSDADDEKTAETQRRAAVALKHMGVDNDAVTRVMAAGYGAIAEEILDIAFANGVKVREDKDLAQMLVAIELNSDIPTEALVAVAEILSYVYKANENYNHGEGNKDNGK